MQTVSRAILFLSLAVAAWGQGGRGGYSPPTGASSGGGTGTGTVTSVFGRTPVVVATAGDYTTALVTESGSLYFTAARAQAAMAGLYQLPITGAPGTWPTFTTFATLATGASTKVVLGNGTLATLDTSITPENVNLYFTNARAIAAMAGLYQTPITGAPGTWPAFISTTGLSTPSIGATPITESFVAGTGGTAANTLVKTDSSFHAVTILTSDTGAYGVAMASVSATAAVEVARLGTVNCLADNTTVIGDLAIAGTGTAGFCRDSGQTSSSAIAITTRIIGVFRSAVSGGALASVELLPAHFGTLITSAAMPSTFSIAGPITLTGSGAGLNLFGCGSQTVPGIPASPANAVGIIAPASCTGQHVIAPPATGATGSTQVLGATGAESGGITPTAWVTPSGGGTSGALVLLEEYTASASTAITFTSRNVTGQSGASFQSDYDEYEVHVVGMVPSVTLHTGVRMSTNGGSSWDATSGNYMTDMFQWRAATSALLGSNTSQTAIWLLWPGADDTATTAGWGLSGKFTLYAPLSTSLFKQISGRFNNFNSASVADVLEVRGTYKIATAVNALELFADTGNFASGQFRLYGVAK